MKIILPSLYTAKRVSKALVSIIMVGLVSSASYASDGIIRSTIVGIEPNGAGTVLYFQGFPAVCADGARRGFLSVNDSNYQAFVSVALTAMATKTPVYVYATSSGGDCHVDVITEGETSTPP